MKKSLTILIFIVSMMILITACRRFGQQQQQDQSSQGSGTRSAETVKPPPDMDREVKSDFSMLTPYTPPAYRHTRLHEGTLPELIPSNAYKLLLPYANTSVQPNGAICPSKYGFVTIDGVVVTDLIYDFIERAHHYTGYPAVPYPAYKLSVNIPGTETMWGMESLKAACALDGSWITPFDYVEIVFTEEAILLMRRYDTIDIDVYDYSGKLLYNMLQCEWVNDIHDDTWIGTIPYSVSEGYGHIPLKIYNTYAYIDILTGQATYVEFGNVNQFSEGLAPVYKGSDESGVYVGLWGYIDRTFEFVIQHEYVIAYGFIDGKALVCTQDKYWHVIDTRGEVLFSFEEENKHVNPLYYDTGYAVHPVDGRGLSSFYTEDFKQIKLPERAMASNNYIHIEELQGGWLGYRDDLNGYYLFKYGKEIFIADNSMYFMHADEDYLVYYSYDTGVSGVLTIDGDDIILPQDNTSITAIPGSDGIKAFILNSNLVSGAFGINTNQTGPFKLIDTNGDTIASGSGILSYDEVIGLYYVLSVDRFAWLDSEGNTFISIPLMSYTLD